jgi:hypothetical protein
MGSVFQVSSNSHRTVNVNDVQQVSSLGFNRAIIVFTGMDRDGRNRIYARVVDSEGNKPGTEFLVSDNLYAASERMMGDQRPAVFTFKDSTSFVVAWMADSNGVMDKHYMRMYTIRSGGFDACCTACPAGKFQTTAGSSNCADCTTQLEEPAGQYLSANATFCTDCTAGKYAAGTASTFCTVCEAGSYADAAGSSTCTVCPAGKYSAATGATSNAHCWDCAAGKYSAAGASACSEVTPTPSPSPSPSNGPDIEGSLMEAAQKYPNCQCTLSWQEIRRSNPRTRTGGLGEFLVEGKYEVWVCLQDNVCSTLDDSFCYVFNEQTLTFEAWGLNAEVKVVKNALQ